MKNDPTKIGNKKSDAPVNKNRSPWGFATWLWIFLIGFLVVRLFFPSGNMREITYDQFRDSLKLDRIDHVVLSDKVISGTFKEQKVPSDSSRADSLAGVHGLFPLLGQKEKSEPEFEVNRVADEELIPLLEKHHVHYAAKKDTGFLNNILLWILPFLFLIILWRLMFRNSMSGRGTGGSAGAGNIFNIGQNRARQYIKNEKNNVSFRDVAGVDEAKEELSEMIEFLKNPDKFTRLGGKLPKGVLLVGPPGTGKTLLARAVAGEANVPFFSLTGSEFVEMFVGVGAARVRDLFKQAKTKAPCIVFIDEIDAIGKSRAHAIQLGSNDERENTLNQLLSEMDGFEPDDGMMIMASTNRPEVLDHALLRPGRFDRQVLVDRPDLHGRVEILRVHTRNLSLDPALDLKKVASSTPGFSGADLANICNEAALMASRKNKKNVQMEDFEEAIERVIAGLEKKSRLINPREKKIVAYHESGHALVGYFTPGADPVQKVSIVPRGLGALGYTLQTPLEDRFLLTQSELEGKIKGLLAGRAAEELIFGEISTGASNDLERATRIATDMVTLYGMSKKLPNLSLKKPDQTDLLGRDSMLNKRSEELERTIDNEVMNLISTCYAGSLALLKSKKKKLTALAEKLLEKEVLQEEDVRKILG